MGQIYSKAFLVMVWLGPFDAPAAVAAASIQDFGKRYRAINKNLRFIGDASFWKDMGRESFSDLEALCLVHFFNRIWFERIWVLQEVILATQIRVLCGTTAIEWDDIVTMSIYLYESGHATAWHELRAASLNNPFVRTLAVAPMQMDNLRKGCRDGVMISEDLVLKLEGLDSHGLENAFCQFLGSMIMVGRIYQCGRPEDKVLAPLALALHKFSGFMESTLMVPDYTKTLEQVYTEAATLIIDKTSELLLLTTVEDPAFRAHPSIPSWVPDFSVQHSNPLNFSKFKPDLDVFHGQHTACSVSISGSQLITRGFWIDTVIQAGPRHDDTSSRDTFQTSPTPFLEFALSLGKQYRTGEDAIQAFIRTFVADQIAHHEGLLQFFGAYVRYHCVASKDFEDILEETSRITGLQSPGDLFTALLEHPESLPSWQVLDAFEGRGDSTTPTFRYLVAWSKAIADGSDHNEDNRLIDVARHLVAECHVGAISFRQMFKGRSGYIGLMPQSAQVGDELWLLPGCKTPCTLRPTKKEGVYQFIGEAYVHGVMHGEFWEDQPHPDSMLIILE